MDLCQATPIGYIPMWMHNVCGFDLACRPLVFTYKETAQLRVWYDNKYCPIYIIICFAANVSFFSFSFSYFLHAGSLLQQDSQDEGLCFHGESESENPSNALASSLLSVLSPIDFLNITVSWSACLILLLLSFCLSFSQHWWPEEWQQIAYLIYMFWVCKMCVHPTVRRVKDALW